MINLAKCNSRQAAIILSENYTLKGSASEPFLLNIINGEAYRLTYLQFKFLSLCNGKNTLRSILGEVGANKINEAHNLLNELSHNNIVLFQKPCEKVLDFPERVPVPHLRNIHWEITKQCNLHCDHCLQNTYLKANETDFFSDDLSLIDDIGHLNVMHVSLSGGEPLLRRDLFEICQLIESKLINLKRLFTNGIFLNRESISELLKLKSKIEIVVGFDGFNVSEMSIRAIDEKTLKQIVEAIKAAILEGINVAINTSVNKFNVANLNQTYERLKGIGVKRWRLGVPMLIGAYSTNHIFFEPETKALHNSYLNLIKLFLSDVIKARKADNKYMDVQLDGIFYLDAIERSDNESFEPIVFMCDYDDKLNSLCIKPNGAVTPCSEQVDNIVGNLKTSSLNEIWYSDRCQSSKRLKLCDVKECINCKMVNWCGGGCRANYDTSGKANLIRDKRSCENMVFLFDSILPLMKSLDFNCKDYIEQGHAR